MSCSNFKVGLRCIPQSFSQALWQSPSGCYADYLSFYSYSTHCLTRHGWLKPKAKQRLFAQAFMPKNQPALGTWVQLHGYLDHSASYPHLQQWLLNKHWAYISYDLPGHGLSNGARASIESFDDYQAAVNQLVELLKTENLPKPWVLCGFSTGGSIALQHQLLLKNFAGLVLVAPLVEPVNWKNLSPFVQPAIIKPLSFFKAYLPRKFEFNSSDAKYLEFVQHQDCLQGHKISLQWALALKQWLANRFYHLPLLDTLPCLILQGDKDTTVNWQVNLLQLARLLPKARVKLLPAAGHQLLNENPAILKEVFAQLTTFLTHLKVEHHEKT